ncbi:riboflavin transporter RibU [Andreesenia angusta]|uniref:Riboflavin transporter n=1 Tax=Andreesenia angusta TaxID=39480 RepID=A0A1S1V661_9FIRM|nr:ECF transporter S component [Andreesenia angusta]OHW61587.1 riboflavin transporter RibU [Andreesenia angusta]
MNKRINSRMGVDYMVKVSVLSVLAFLIMLIELPLPFTPEFLKIDLSDLPSLVASFAMGPVAGILVQLLKNILKIALRGTNTLFVGELANFLVGSIYVVVASLIYRRKRTKGSAVKGLVLATLLMSVFASAANYFVLLPFYAKVYGVPLEAYVDMAKSVNAYVVDLRSFIVFGIFPFNFVKGVLIAIVGYPVYTRLRMAIER